MRLVLILLLCLLLVSGCTQIDIQGVKIPKDCNLTVEYINNTANYKLNGDCDLEFVKNEERP